MEPQWGPMRANGGKWGATCEITIVSSCITIVYNGPIRPTGGNVRDHNSLNNLSVRVLYNCSNNLVNGSRGAQSVARLLFGHFYYKTTVQLTLFTFLTRGPEWNSYFCFNITEITSFTLVFALYEKQMGANGGQWRPTGAHARSQLLLHVFTGPMRDHNCCFM